MTEEIKEPTLLFVKPGSIGLEDKVVLREARVIVVEMDDPSSVRLIRAGTELDGTEMLGLAAKAMVDCSSTAASTMFGDLLTRVLAKRFAPKNP